jgi:hypothetical protein
LPLPEGAPIGARGSGSDSPEDLVACTD